MNDHPDLPGQLVGDVADGPEGDAWPVREASAVHRSGYLDVDLETIEGPEGDLHERVVVRPNGAVGVLAIDADDRVLLVEQYRHPLGRRVVEVPAGTRDVEGEDPLETAVRELGEEADLVAATWEPLLELAVTPGYSSERLVLFRASDLSPVPEDERTPRHAEEAGMRQLWLPFERAVDAVLDGRVQDAKTCGGVLAELARRRR